MARSLSVSPSNPSACGERRWGVRSRDPTCTSAALMRPSSPVSGVTLADTDDPVRVGRRTVPVPALFTAAQTDGRS